MIHRSAFPVTDIVTGDRTRQEFRNVDSLARSIKERGLLSPLNLRMEADGTKVLVCGGRRLAAVKSLGWETVPVLIIEDDIDELEALYAEGDENTEREPFTPAEAVRHRQRIHDIEARAAKDRQDEGREKAHESRRVGCSNLEHPTPKPQPQSETKTRHRTAKATGYSASTLDKAEEIVKAAESEATPEPVRKAAQQAAQNLAKPGAKVDREFKAFREEVAKSDPDVRAANYRKALTAALSRAGELTNYEPDRVIEVADESLLWTITQTCRELADWGERIQKKKSSPLRVVNGGQK